MGLQGTTGVNTGATELPIGHGRHRHEASVSARVFSNSATPLRVVALVQLNVCYVGDGFLQHIYFFIGQQQVYAHNASEPLAYGTVRD